MTDNQKNINEDKYVSDSRHLQTMYQRKGKRKERTLLLLVGTALKEVGECNLCVGKFRGESGKAQQTIGGYLGRVGRML